MIPPRAADLVHFSHKNDPLCGAGSSCAVVACLDYVTCHVCLRTVMKERATTAQLVHAPGDRNEPLCGAGRACDVDVDLARVTCHVCLHSFLKFREQASHDMLEKLAAHYGEPVQPISRYCASLHLWSRALHERSERALHALAPDLETEKDRSRRYEIRAAVDQEVRKAETDRDKEGRLPSGERAAKLRELGLFRRQAYQVDSVFRDISKSSLLYRLLYCGEKLREEMCPEHKGRWNGQAMLDGCAHGCHGTGWLSSAPVHKSVTPLSIATIDASGNVADISPPVGSFDPPET